MTIVSRLKKASIVLWVFLHHESPLALAVPVILNISNVFTHLTANIKDKSKGSASVYTQMMTVTPKISVLLSGKIYFAAKCKIN